MQNSSHDIDRYAELRGLVDNDVAAMIASANERGFSSSDALRALASSLEANVRALEADPDPADDLPAGPHSTPRLVDHDKTPGTGALPEAGQFEIDPGVG